MFLINDTIEYAGPPVATLRILWIDMQQDLAYIFELRHANAWPRPVTVSSLAADLQARRARLLLTDPCRPVPPQPVPEHHRRLQARAWEAVGALHAHQPDIFQRGWRARAVADHARRLGMSRSSIMRYLQRYWERGQTPDALLPDYANSGAPGRTRVATGGVKRGRPSKQGAAAPNVDAAMRAIFQAAVARQEASAPLFSRRAAYRAMLAEHFRDCDPGAVPSYGQFIYWIGRDGCAAVQDPVR